MATTAPLEAFIEVMEDYNAIVYSLVSSGMSYFPRPMDPLSLYPVDSEPCFPELVSSSAEFVTKLLGFTNMSSSLADAVIKAVRGLTSQGSESIEIHPRDDVLRAIEETMGAYREMRIADNEVLRKCMELPLDIAKAALAGTTNKSANAWRELQKLRSYPTSLSTRNALPIEDCLVLMKTWWKANHYESLRGTRPLPPSTALYDRLISGCEELITQVVIRASLRFKPLEQHLRFFTHSLLESINERTVENEVLSRGSGALVDMTTWYIESSHRMSSETLDLAFNRDALSVTAYFAEPLHTTPNHLFNEVMESYTKVLSFTYELVALRFKLNVHITWHTPTALLLRDSMVALKPLYGLHDSLVNARDKATTEIEHLRNLAFKSKELYPCHGHTLYPVTDETPEHFKCIRCLVDNLIEHTAWIKQEIVQDACYSSQSQYCSGIPQRQPSHTSLLFLAERLLSPSPEKKRLKKHFTVFRDSTSSLISDLPRILGKVQSDSEFQNLLGHINMLSLLQHEIDSLLSVSDCSNEILTASTTLDFNWFNLPESQSLKGSLSFFSNASNFQISSPVLIRCSNKEQIAFSRACAAAKRGESSESKKDDRLQKKPNDLSKKQSSTRKSFSGNWDF